MNNSSPILKKMMRSYILLVILISVFISCTALTLFSWNYNQAIFQSDERNLTHIKSNLEIGIISEAQNICSNIMFEGKNPSITLPYIRRSNVAPSDYYRAYENLVQVATINSSLVIDAAIYYAQDRVLVSSLSGMKYLDTYQGDSDVSRFVEQFLDTSSKFGLHTIDAAYLLENNQLISGEAALVLTMQHPKGGFIALQLNKSAVSSLMADLFGSVEADLVLMDASGFTVSQIRRIEHTVYSNEKILEKMGGQNTEGGNYVDWVEGKALLVSYKNLPFGYHLYKVESVNHFYSQTIQIILVILGIMLLAIVCGWIMAATFSKRFYSPLKNVVDTVQKRFEVLPNPLKWAEYNEYDYIHHALDAAAVEMVALKDTLEKNKGQIKNNFVLGLLNRTITDKKKITEIADLLNVKMDNSQYCAAYISLSTIKCPNISQAVFQYVKYNLIIHLDEFPETGVTILCGEMAEEIIGFVVIGIPKNWNQLLFEISSQLSGIVTPHQIGLKLFVGEVQMQAEDLYLSYQQAKIAMKYAFFYPKQTVFQASSYLEQEQNRQYPTHILQALTAAFHAQSLKKITSIVKEALHYCEEKHLSADTCQQLLLAFLQQLISYGKNVGFDFRDGQQQNAYLSMEDLEDIDCFQNWYLTDCRLIFEKLQAQSKGCLNVEQAKEYILAHLNEDLSLEIVAEKIGLTSAGYLSKIFKTETGENFVDFITRQRMQTAVQLLETTEDSLTEICEKIGFRNPTYLNKKFKETYGETPMTFRRNKRSTVSS